MGSDFAGAISMYWGRGGFQDFWLASGGLLRAIEESRARKPPHLFKRQCRIKMMTNRRFHAREERRSEALRLEAAKAASGEGFEPKHIGAHFYTLLT